jgi:hypothetical protein
VLSEQKIKIETWGTEAGIAIPEKSLLVRQRLGKHVSAVTNNHATINGFAESCVFYAVHAEII